MLLWNGLVLHCPCELLRTRTPKRYLDNHITISLKVTFCPDSTWIMLLAFSVGMTHHPSKTSARVRAASCLWSPPFPIEGLSRAVFTMSSSRSFAGGTWRSPHCSWSGSSAAWLLSAFPGRLLPLSHGQLYISSGVTPDLEVWNTVFMLFFFFFLPLLRHAVLLSKNWVKGLIEEQKSNKEGKQFWICCGCCHGLTRGVFCYLGIKSIWVKLPVPLCHRSLCQPVNHMLAIKMGQWNCCAACFGWLCQIALF